MKTEIISWKIRYFTMKRIFFFRFCAWQLQRKVYLCANLNKQHSPMKLPNEEICKWILDEAI